MAESLRNVGLEADGSIPVTIVSGGGTGGTASDFGDPFPAAGTAAGFIDPSGDLAGAEVDADGNLKVNVVAGGAGGGDVNLIEVGGAAIALGQAAMAASLPVVIANNQSAVPISAAALPLPSGAATEATLATVLTSTDFAAAFGTAGTADTQVLSVQGIASMTPVQVSQATASNLNAQAVGNIAADSADSGNPVKIGMIAYSPDGTTPGTAVAELDRSNAKSDLDGRMYVNPYSPRTLTVHLDGTSAYTDQALIADPGDGFQAVITNIIASTGAATALNFFLEEGSTKIFGPIYLEAVAGRGFCSGPMYLPCTASTAVTLTSSANIAQSFQVSYFLQAV